MDRDRFHNQLALSIGYKLINDKHYTLEVEESDDPWITLKVQGQDHVRFKASDKAYGNLYDSMPEINSIVEAFRYAYIEANKPF